MHYYIDGYNLLFRTLHAGDNLQKQRRELIEDLEAKCHFLELDATIVFDSHYQPDDGSRSHFNNLEICFTAVSETADEYILQELKESSTPTQETVVTSDRQLAWRCRRYLANTESVENFILWLDKRLKNKRRQIKLTAKLLKQPPSESVQKPSIVPEPQPVAEKAVPEGSFDFYLDAFEKELEKTKPIKPEIKAEDETGRQKARKKKAKLASDIEEKPFESDMQRWLRNFERKENEGNSHGSGSGL